MFNEHIPHKCLYEANHSIALVGAQLCIYLQALITKVHFVRLVIKDIYTKLHKAFVII